MIDFVVYWVLLIDNGLLRIYYKHKKESFLQRVSFQSFWLPTIRGFVINRQTTDGQPYSVREQGACLEYMGTSSVREKAMLLSILDLAMCGFRPVYLFVILQLGSNHCLSERNQSTVGCYQHEFY